MRGLMNMVPSSVFGTEINTEMYYIAEFYEDIIIFFP